MGDPGPYSSAAMAWFDDLSRKVSQGGSDLARAVRSMDAVDALPLASQAKSVVQIISGDHDGAARTQQNFSRRCVGVSQLRSAIERQQGNEEAAAVTQAEFARSTDEFAQAAMFASAVGAQKGALAVEHAAHAARRIRQSRLAADLARGAESLLVSGVAVAERTVHGISEGELGRRFAELVHLHDFPSPRHAGTSSGDDISPPNSEGVTSSLDTCTLLTEVTASQSGAQCPCCMESLQAGEEMRVLPCFHPLHAHCAEAWLSTKPICPICRCDIRASLEKHRR